MKTEPKWVLPGMMLTLWLVWGYSWTACKLGLPYIGPLQLAFWRTLLGVITLGAVMLMRSTPLAPTLFWPTFCLGMTQTAGFGALINLALLSGGAGEVSVLAHTMPFWTLMLARLFLHERLQRRQWAAVGLALLGLGMILQPWHPHASLGANMLAMGAGVSWALAAVIAKRVHARHQVGALALTFWQMLWGLIPLGLLAWLLPGRETQWNGQLLAVLLYVGVFASGLGWLVWLSLLYRLPAGIAGLNVLAVPAVALLLAWAQLGETPDASEALGLVLIGLALALLAWSSVRRSRKA